MKKNLHLDREILNKKGILPKVYSEHQFLIWSFLKAPSECDWRREAVAAKKIWEMCPDLTFWRYLADELDFRLNSMYFFLSKDGKKIIKRNKFFYYEQKKSFKQNEKK